MVTKPNSVRLIEKLDQIDRELKKQNSFTQTFNRAIIAGIGTAIGVTIIGGIVIGVLNTVIHTAQDIPILNKIQQIPGK